MALFAPTSVSVSGGKDTLGGPPCPLGLGESSYYLPYIQWATNGFYFGRDEMVESGDIGLEGSEEKSSQLEGMGLEERS